MFCEQGALDLAQGVMIRVHPAPTPCCRLSKQQPEPGSGGCRAAGLQGSASRACADDEVTVLDVFKWHCWLLTIHYLETVPRVFFLLCHFQPRTPPQVPQVQFQSLFTAQVMSVCSGMQPREGAMD